MKKITWSPDKERDLKADTTRNISFEEIVAAIEGGGLLDDIEHPNSGRYPGQRMLVVFAHGYVYAVPYVETSDELFLKTVFPSRRLNKLYVLRNNDEEES